jgi:hypothetical protein
MIRRKQPLSKGDSATFRRQDKEDVDLVPSRSTGLGLVGITTVISGALLFLIMGWEAGRNIQHLMRGTTNLGNLSSKLSIDDEDFSLAGDQSYGLLDGISNQAWKRLQNRVRTRNNHKYPNNPYEFKDQANQWYQHNFEPDFTCLYEERVGGNGDGPKWVWYVLRTVIRKHGLKGFNP